MHSFLFRNLSHPERNIYLGTALSMHTPDKTKLHLFSGFNLVYYISFTVCYIYMYNLHNILYAYKLDKPCMLHRLFFNLFLLLPVGPLKLPFNL